MEYPLHTIFVAVYLLALIAVGAVKAMSIKSQEDFSLAGRGLSTVVLVGTLLATWIGTGSLFGNAQKTYGIGVAAFLLPVGGSLGIVALYFLAQRIRRFGQFTIQDILEARFGVGARILATLALLGAYIVIVSYQYRAGSAVLERVVPDLAGTVFAVPETAAGEPVPTLLGLPLENMKWSVVAVAMFVIAYTALAGMFSVAYTDVANGIMMLIGIGLAIPILLSEAGGWETAVAALGKEQQSYTSYWTPVKILGLSLPPFLLMLGDANMYQRFFSAKSPESARRSAAGMFVGVLVLELAIILVAVLATSLVAQGKLAAPENPGHVIIMAAFDVLPAFLGAMLVATAVAVVVSTADSYLLSPSTSLVRDVYQRFINPDASPAKLVFLGRFLVLVLGLIALVMAFGSDEFFGLALFAYTIYGCAITPVMLAAFFWKRATKQGAVASIVTGALVALAWESLGLLADGTRPWADDLAASLGVGTLEAVLVAAPLSVLALVAVSFATPAPAAEQVNSI